MKGDYQDLVDEISALLGVPATLENRDFGLIAFGAHDTEDDTAMDPVRTRSIVTRKSTPAVRAWFEVFGIARATGPVRIPAAPDAGGCRTAARWRWPCSYGCARRTRWPGRSRRSPGCARTPARTPRPVPPPPGGARPSCPRPGRRR